jgi:hypothetical protein
LIELAKLPQLSPSGAVLIAHYVHRSCLPTNNAGQLACGLGLGLAGIMVEEQVAVEAAEQVGAAVARAVGAEEVVVDSNLLEAQLYQPRPAAMI